MKNVDFRMKNCGVATLLWATENLRLFILYSKSFIFNSGGLF